MPTYTFRDKQTDEVFDVFMSINELDRYIEQNEHLQQVPTAPAIVDPVNIGVKKPPSDFQKYILGRVKSAVPEANAVASKRWDIPKEI